jgi:hypothetical protein
MIRRGLIGPFGTSAARNSTTQAASPILKLCIDLASAEVPGVLHVRSSLVSPRLPRARPLGCGESLVFAPLDDYRGLLED